MVVPILLSIISVLWLFFIYTGLGYLIFKLFGLSFQSRLLRILTSFALGFCITGNAIMVLCFLQHASSVWIISLLLLFTILGLPFYRHVVSDLIQLTGSVISVLKFSHRLASLLLIVLVGGYAVRGLLPPTGFDALMYHLSTVKLYLEHGGFWNIYFNGQSDYPMLTEMNFMIGLALNNDIICKTISFLLGLMTMAIIAYLCCYYLKDKKLIIPSLLVFCTFTCIIANMSNCDVDIPQALWMTLALVVLEKYLKEEKILYLVVSAIIAGMSVQSKIFGVFIVPMLLLRLTIQRKRSLFSVLGIKEVGILVFIPFLMGLPWYIKSYLYTHTILSSIKLSRIFEIPKPTEIKFLSKYCDYFLKIIIRVITAPWTFSVFPGQHRNDTFGPLFIAVIPFLLFIKIPRRIKILLAIIGTYLAQILLLETWFMRGGASIRYSIFILVTGVPVIIWTVKQLCDYPKTQKILQLMVICSIFLGSLIFIKRYHKEWIAFLLFQSRDQYYNRILPEYAVITTINKLPKDKVVMPIYNYSDYLLDAPYITAYRRYKSLNDMKEDFKEKNIGYIFANDKLDTSKNRDTFSELTGKVCIDSTNGFYLFRLSEYF